MDDEQQMIFNMGKDSFKNLIIETHRAKGDSMDSVMKLNFNNADVNSLEQLFGIINKAVMTMSGGSSM